MAKSHCRNTYRMIDIFAAILEKYNLPHICSVSDKAKQTTTKQKQNSTKTQAGCSKGSTWSNPPAISFSHPLTSATQSPSAVQHKRPPAASERFQRFMSTSEHLEGTLMIHKCRAQMLRSVCFLR